MFPAWLPCWSSSPATHSLSLNSVPNREQSPRGHTGWMHRTHSNSNRQSQECQKGAVAGQSDRAQQRGLTKRRTRTHAKPHPAVSIPGSALLVAAAASTPRDGRIGRLFVSSSLPVFVFFFIFIFIFISSSIPHLIYFIEFIEFIEFISSCTSKFAIRSSTAKSCTPNLWNPHSPPSPNDPFRSRRRSFPGSISLPFPP